PAPVVSGRGWLSEWDREEIRRAAEEARRASEEVRINSREIAEEARMAGQRAMEDARIAMRDFRFEMPKFTGQSIIANVPFEFESRSFGYKSNVEIGPPPQFMQGEPADSLYQLAREAFNRQDYSRAATRFAELISKYPSSRLVPQSAYYQAFSLYRVGTVESLRTALRVLETNASRFEYESRMSKSDAPALQARVLRALADRNEPGVEGKLRELYAKYPSVSCDQEAIGIKAQVLSSLYQTDPEAAMPYIRQHLGTRDACNAELRRTAVFLLANRPTPERTALIVQVAKTDTVRSVRSRAIEVLSRMPGDDAIAALQQFMNDGDEQIQASAVRSLMRSDNPKARAAMRALIDRRDASERQRLEAIRSFDRDNTSPEDAAYLRSLFNRQGESDRIKDAVLSALSQVPSEENSAFLLSVARNTNESSSLRATALRRVTSRQNLSTEDLIKLYDASDSRSMRQTLVQALSQRGEEQAINKLIDIVRYSTDPEVRSHSIQLLLQKKDPAIQKRVLDLINKGGNGGNE
ncbi:MAG TPA: HEAT repeat domain-containing protein, partial [Gemmatimonadaceae bacterium]|nr:HEAT repeat domain-containing protein [Gemmatimonadaceae bacterium]